MPTYLVKLTQIYTIAESIEAPDWETAEELFRHNLSTNQAMEAARHAWENTVVMDNDIESEEH